MNSAVRNSNTANRQPQAALQLRLDPEILQAGENVHIQLVVSGFNPNEPISTSFATDGGQMHGNPDARSTHAHVSTLGVRPGRYTVRAYAAQIDRQQNLSASVMVTQQFEVV